VCSSDLEFLETDKGWTSGLAGWVDLGSMVKG